MVTWLPFLPCPETIRPSRMPNGGSAGTHPLIGSSGRARSFNLDDLKLQRGEAVHHPRRDSISHSCPFIKRRHY
jgi:hypothetical protein